jgi:hypothetical protein
MRKTWMDRPVSSVWRLKLMKLPSYIITEELGKNAIISCNLKENLKLEVVVSTGIVRLRVAEITQPRFFTSKLLRGVEGSVFYPVIYL